MSFSELRLPLFHPVSPSNANLKITGSSYLKKKGGGHEKTIILQFSFSIVEIGLDKSTVTLGTMDSLR